MIDQAAHELIPDGSKVKVTKSNALEMVRYRRSRSINCLIFLRSPNIRYSTYDQKVPAGMPTKL